MGYQLDAIQREPVCSTLNSAILGRSWCVAEAGELQGRIEEVKLMRSLGRSDHSRSTFPLQRKSNELKALWFSSYCVSRRCDYKYQMSKQSAQDWQDGWTTQVPSGEGKRQNSIDLNCV